MSESAIVARGLGKRYRINEGGPDHDTLRDWISASVAAPFRAARALLEGRRVRSEARDFWALREVSFDIKRGDVVGIVGRNGAGKTTLLKILSRITAPTEGSADLYGRVAALLEVGTGFHAELSGRENVFLNGAILGMRRAEIERKFDEIVAFAEVERFIDTPVKHYSTGMYLRLAFAVAAHLEPEILVVDEVLAVGDMAFQKKCLGKMEDVAREGRTVLFVSHNMSAVTGLCSRGILLEQGRIVHTGTASEVVSEYLRGAAGTSARATWPRLADAPGSDGFKLAAVSVLDERGNVASVLDVERPVRIRLDFNIGAPSLKFRFCLGFHTQGVCALSTVEPVELVRSEGEHRATVEIPGNVLAEHDYTLYVSVFSSRGKKSHFCILHDVVAFQVFDARRGSSARGDYSEGLLGVTRPLLRWTSEALRESGGHASDSADR
jgi:lipopolysaccharide transport system ATP-binding protein